jgi:hypothetical protein
MRTGGRTNRQDDDANSRYSQVIYEKLNFCNNGSPCVRCGLSEGVVRCYNEIAHCVAVAV